MTRSSEPISRRFKRRPPIDQDMLSRLIRIRPEDVGGHDIYLAYSGAMQLRVAGFLVTDRTSADRPLAYCPVSVDANSLTRELAADLVRQLHVAVRIARQPATSHDTPDAIWLGASGTATKPMPQWIYGLSCIPLTRDWDGHFMHPRPFCPSLFAAMATQPQAVEWLREYQAQGPALSQA